MKIYRNIILRTCLTVGLIAFVSACAHNETNKSRLVKKNADLAVENCGKGKVKKVTTDGYKCK